MENVVVISRVSFIKTLLFVLLHSQLYCRVNKANICSWKNCEIALFTLFVKWSFENCSISQIFLYCRESPKNSQISWKVNEGICIELYQYYFSTPDLFWSLGLNKYSFTAIPFTEKNLHCYTRGKMNRKNDIQFFCENATKQNKNDQTFGGEDILVGLHRTLPQEK